MSRDDPIIQEGGSIDQFSMELDLAEQNNTRLTRGDEAGACWISWSLERWIRCSSNAEYAWSGPRSGPDLVLHLTRFGHQNFEIARRHGFLFHEKHHPQGFLGSELAWDVQIGGRLHRRAVIFVMMIIIIVTNKRKFQTWWHSLKAGASAGII